MMAGAEHRGSIGRNEGFKIPDAARRAKIAIEKALHPEREWTVTSVDTQPRISDIKEFTKWYQDRETSLHFVPPLIGPNAVEDYYLHSADKMFFIARNVYGEPLAVSSLLRKNPFLKGSNKKIAYTEKTIVDPRKRRRGIGLTLRTTMNDYIFEEDENGKPRFDQAQLYVMADKDAGDYRTNLNFFMDEMGYIFDQRNPEWREYAERAWGLKKERHAFLLILTDGNWKKAKERNPKLHGAELRLAA